MILQLLSTHLLPPLGVCDSRDQAAHYHFLALAFVSYPALGWSQRKKVYVPICSVNVSLSGLLKRSSHATLKIFRKNTRQTNFFTRKKNAVN